MEQHKIIKEKMGKILQKIPFAVRLYFFLDIWAVLCGLFAVSFVLSRARFATPQMAGIVLASFLILIAISAIMAPAEYGILKVVWIKGKKDAQVLNDNIVGNKIDPNVSDETLKKIFVSLLKRPMWGMISGFQYGMLSTLGTMLVAFFVGSKLSNILVIFIGGATGTVLLMIFANFFIERFISDVLKQCQRTMQDRGLEMGKIAKSTLKNRFNYFIILIFVIFVILLTFTDLSLSVIGVVAVGLTMVILASRILFASIYDIFMEVKNFVEKLPKKERAFYLTSNLTKESIDLSKNLNTTADELYQAREKTLKQTAELQTAYEEIEKRKADLEKFYKLIVGRELRMVELKKKIKELEEEEKKEE